jgi:hypothetical protein
MRRKPMKKFLMMGALILITFVVFTHQPVFAQDGGTCSDLVFTAYELVQDSCQAAGQDQACYGNTALFASPTSTAINFIFDAPGDIVPVADIETLRMSEMNERRGEWGISLMRLHVELPSAGVDDNIELIFFGNVQIENAGGTTNVAPMQAFYFRSGVGDRPCSEAPDSGMLIQTPKGLGTVTLLINEVVVELGSTAYLQADPGANMLVNIVEGDARLTAFGTTVSVPAGMRSTIPLGTDGTASGAPNPPEPYNNNDLITLPIALLSRPIVIAPAAAGAAPTTSSQAFPVSPAEPFIIYGATIKGGGLEIFERPTRDSERLYASLGGFKPIVIGRTADSEWLDIYFCTFGNVEEGWTRSNRLILDADDLQRLAVTDPEPTFTVPEITCTPDLEMPLGIVPQAESEEPTVHIQGNIATFEVYDCVYIGNPKKGENLFQWYRAQAEVDSAGRQIGPQTYIGGPFTGTWRPGCPGIPSVPTSPSGSSPTGSSGSSAAPSPDYALPTTGYALASAGIALLAWLTVRTARRRK